MRRKIYRRFMTVLSHRSKNKRFLKTKKTNEKIRNWDFCTDKKNSIISFYRYCKLLHEIGWTVLRHWNKQHWKSRKSSCIGQISRDLQESCFSVPTNITTRGHSFLTLDVLHVRDFFVSIFSQQQLSSNYGFTKHFSWKMNTHYLRLSV